MTMMSLLPAYGRDYKSQKAVLEDFRNGKDFVVNCITSPYNGKYCSKRDFNCGDRLYFRYNRQSSVMMYDVKASDLM